MNRLPLQDIVHGRYGRKIAYADVAEITRANVVKVVSDCIGTFYFNKPVIKYLWAYKDGDQPILYRQKKIRDDIVNKVVENHAYEIVRFKNGQTYGEPVQYVSMKKDDATNKAVDALNDYFRGAEKHLKDINSGEWTSAVGTGFKAIQMKDGEVPFRIVTPTPLNTFVIYSRFTEEPLLAVQELFDEDGRSYKLCYSKTHEYRIQDSRLMNVGTADAPVYEKLHAFGDIPIIEYPNNQNRISDIELVISMLDAINDIQSNRQDAIAQFVQSFIKFVNCDIDEATFNKMKMMGALVVKSNNGDLNKADVDVISQELNQTQTQVAKEDLLDNVMSIEAIPNKEQQNTGGDTAGAVSLRAGWDHAKQVAKLKDPYIAAADKRLAMIALNILRIRKGVDAPKLGGMDFETQISHSPTDNLYIKTESLQMLLNCGIHPLVAIKTSGLWADAEKVFLNSKDYLDAKYQTIENVQEQEAKAQELLKAQQKTNAENTVV